MPKFLTITEYSKIHGKDPGNIRRMIYSGRIDAKKIGNKWVIKEGTAFPKDARTPEGKRMKTLREWLYLNGYSSGRIVIPCKIKQNRSI